VLEIILVYSLFYFAGISKPLYVIFSIAVIIAICFYLIYGRYREQVKIKSRRGVLKRYLGYVFKIVIVIVSLTAVSVIFTWIFLLIKGHF
jgi:predicted PurR-regulated permease PerM